MTRPLIVIDDVITVPGHGYYPGSGPLRMRVTKVPPNIQRSTGWVELRGHEIRPDGGEAPEERWTLVRLALVSFASFTPERRS